MARARPAPVSGRTATYVVAASDAPTRVKAQADYICGATANDVQMQAAINAANAGDTVLIVGPSFSITNFVTPKSGITIVFRNTTVTAAAAINHLLGSSSAVTDLTLIFENVDFNGASLANYGVMFEGANSTIDIQGRLYVRNCLLTNIYLYNVAKLHFDRLETLGLATIGSNSNRGVLIAGTNIYGNNIIATNNGNYVGTTYYNSLEIGHSAVPTSVGRIGSIVTDSPNIHTVIITNTSDFTFGYIRTKGALTGIPGGSLPDGLDLINTVYNVVIGAFVSLDAKSNAVVLGGGAAGSGVYNTQLGNIIATGGGGAAVCIGQAIGELAWNIEIGNILAYNNAKDSPAGAQTGLYFANAYDIQIDSYRAYDDQSTPTQTYPIIFANIDNHALDRIQFGTVDFRGSPTALPLYTVAADMQGQVPVEVVKKYTSDLFNAAALTDSANIWQQPANSILLGVTMQLDTVFAATGMTDLDVTVGDATDNDGILAGAMNLTSDAAQTKYKDKGVYFDATAGTLYKSAATQWVAYATAVGANLSTLTAGQITITFRYIQL